jgi:hypothetical protein
MAAVNRHLGVLIGMTHGTTEVASLDDLRRFVERTICDQQHLLLGAFRFHEEVLVRNGQVCGLHFTLSGPRAVQYAAICDLARHTILFYDCNGERLRRSDLSFSAGLREELTGLARMGVKLAA